LKEALWSAEGFDHGFVGFGGLLDTFCFTLLAVVYNR
jgi:hypothetical protein